jgi:hypothetical protein
MVSLTKRKLPPKGTMVLDKVPKPKSRDGRINSTGMGAKALKLAGYEILHLDTQQVSHFYQ